MKFFAKVVATIAAILICLGLVVGVIGLVMGATWDGAWRGSWSWGRWGGSSLSESYEGVTALDFDLGLAEVNIQEGDEFSIQADSVRFEITSAVKDGIWKIDTKETRFWRWIGNHRGAGITITLPRGFVADDLVLEMGMGSLEAGTLQSKDRAKVEVGMGKIAIDRLAAPEIRASCGMGTVRLNRAESQNLTLDCGMGSIQVTVKGAEEDYGCTLDVGMGDVVVGSQRYSGLGNKTSYNTGAQGRLDVDCGMGSVTIAFAED